MMFSSLTPLLLAQVEDESPVSAQPSLVDAVPGAFSTRAIILITLVFALSGIAYIVALILQRQPEASVNQAAVRLFILRVRAWIMMCAILVTAMLMKPVVTVVLFGLLSFWALREFITLTPTRHGDHRALFWIFFLFLPGQYVLVGLALDHEKTAFYYGLYSIALPVYAMLFIPTRVALSGDPRRFLERIAKIQSGLLICVYALSYAPAILSLQLGTWAPKELGGPRYFTPIPAERCTAQDLLFYFILTTQLGDVFQYLWSKLLTGRVIAPDINSGKTWGGFFGGVASSTLVGVMLYWATPFSLPEAACISALTAVMGFAGSMTMSAIKRDRGVRDFGTLVQGHAGILDRIDSICFAAPVFFHFVRFYFSNTP